MSGKRILVAGSNGGGQLATNSLDDAHEFIPCSFFDQTPGVLPPGTKGVLQIACGSNHTLLLLRLENGGTQLYGSGDGRRGQLGPDYFRDPSSSESSDAGCRVFKPLDIGRTVKNIDLQDYCVRLIAAGWETSYVVLSYPERDDILLSFGSNDYGNLGVGSPKNQAAEMHIVDLKRVEGVNQFAGLIRVDSLVASTHHVVVHVTVVSTERSQKTFVLGWGASRHGQLSDGTSPHARPPQSTPSPRIVPLKHSASVVSIAAGFHHTVFLHSDGLVSALGSNRKHQIQHLDLLTHVKSIACTWHGTYTVVEKSGRWSVFATGSNNKGQLGYRSSQTTGAEHPTKDIIPSVSFPFPPEKCRLLKLACGSEHVLCLSSIPGGCNSLPSTEVWAWGWNEHGNLGTGDTGDLHLPTKIWPPRDGGEGRVVDIWAGCGTSWLILEHS